MQNSRRPVGARSGLQRGGADALTLGMMALGIGEGAEIRAPMAITVIVGLTTSTALTLLVIPTIYVAVERLRTRTAPAAVPVTSAK